MLLDIKVNLTNSPKIATSMNYLTLKFNASNQEQLLL